MKAENNLTPKYGLGVVWIKFNLFFHFYLFCHADLVEASSCVFCNAKHSEASFLLRLRGQAHKVEI